MSKAILRIAASATSMVPSATANSIQVLLACEGLARAGAGLSLSVPGTGCVDFEDIRSRYGLRGESFSIQRHPSRPRLKRLDFSLSCLRAARGFDLVYTWTIQIATLAALRGIPSAYEAHDLPVGGGKRWFDWYTRSKTPKTVLFITEALRDRMRSLYPALREEDCLIAPNAVSAEDYEGLPSLREAKKQLGFPTDKVTLSCSGHLYAGRGSDLFLELAKRFPNGDFRWFGGNPRDVEVCENKARAMGLENVTFHGFIPRDRLPLMQAACDILLMPYGSKIAGSSGGNSADICSPMKMFEYMAVGRCILSGDLPVIHEILDRDHAVFCEPDNVDSWSAAVAALMADQERRESMGQRVKTLASRYTWEQRGQSFLRHIQGQAQD